MHLEKVFHTVPGELAFAFVVVGRGWRDKG